MQIVPISQAFDGAQDGNVNAALPEPIHAYVDEKILYDLDPTKNDLIPCQIIGLRAAAGLSMTVSVLLEDHSLYSEVPFHMVYLKDKKPKNLIDLDSLVTMNSPLTNSITLEFNQSVQVAAFRLGKQYVGTVKWGGFKSLKAHVMTHPNGQLAMVPIGAQSKSEKNLPVTDEQKLQDMVSPIATMPDFFKTIDHGIYTGGQIIGFEAVKNESLQVMVDMPSAEGIVRVPINDLYTKDNTELDGSLPADELLYKVNPGESANYTYYDQLGRDACQCYFKQSKELKPGQYLGTIDYYNGGDFIAHLVRLDNNQVALLPSHKIQFNMGREQTPTFPRYGKLSSAFVVEPDEKRAPFLIP